MVFYSNTIFITGKYNYKPKDTFKTLVRPDTLRGNYMKKIIFLISFIIIAAFIICLYIYNKKSTNTEDIPADEPLVDSFVSELSEEEIIEILIDELRKVAKSVYNIECTPEYLGKSSYNEEYPYVIGFVNKANSFSAVYNMDYDDGKVKYGPCSTNTGANAYYYMKLKEH